MDIYSLRGLKNQRLSKIGLPWVHRTMSKSWKQLAPWPCRTRMHHGTTFAICRAFLSPSGHRLTFDRPYSKGSFHFVFCYTCGSNGPKISTELLVDRYRRHTCLARRFGLSVEGDRESRHCSVSYCSFSGAQSGPFLGINILTCSLTFHRE